MQFYLHVNLNSFGPTHSTYIIVASNVDEDTLKNYLLTKVILVGVEKIKYKAVPGSMSWRGQGRSVSPFG